MGAEILNQDEIDNLIHGIHDIEPAITSRLSGMVTPEMVSTARTMLDRYYYALTHRGFHEQRIAKENLRQAAFKVWLCRYGFVDKSDFVNFINKEAEKRGISWRLSIR